MVANGQFLGKMLGISGQSFADIHGWFFSPYEQFSALFFHFAQE
jgi:hypothetical protein